MADAFLPAANTSSPVVRAAPLLAWRILIGIFAYGCASILVRNAIRAANGEPVLWVEIAICGPLFLVAGWLFPQTVTLTETTIVQVRFFWLMRTRMAVEDIHFYWETNRLALNDYLGKSMTAGRESNRDANQPVVLVQSKDGNTRIVLNHYHVGRDRIVAELKRRGVQTYEQMRAKV